MKSKTDRLEQEQEAADAALPNSGASSGTGSVNNSAPNSPGLAKRGKQRSGSITSTASTTATSGSCSNSKGKSGSNTSEADGTARRPRSGSMETDYALGLSKESDDSVAGLHKEIRAIRATRRDGGGCNCRPLKVDKLSVSGLKKEMLVRVSVYLRVCVLSLYVCASPSQTHSQ